MNCSTTSVSRWSGPSSRATPTSRAPSRAGSVGSGTWAAASTTPGDGSRRRSHSESRRCRAGGSACSHGVGSSASCTTASVRWNTAPRPSHGRVRWATNRRCPGDDVARVGHLRLLSSAPRPRPSWPRSRGARSRRLVTAGVAPWRRWIGGAISLVHTDYDAALPELREAAAQFGDIGNRVGPSPRSASRRRHRDDARQLRRSRACAAAGDRWVGMPWEPTPCRAG